MNGYNELKSLERKILKAGKNINQHHKNFVKARTGSSNSNWNTPNKHGFTKNQYETFVRKAMKLQYEVYDKLIRQYKAASNRYRNQLGLRRINLGPPWTTNYKSFISKKMIGGNVINYNNINRLTAPYKNNHSVIFKPQMGAGGGGRHTWSTLTIPKKTFYPNVQLLNALLPARMNAAHAAAETLRRKTLSFRLSGMMHKRKLNMEAAKLALKYSRPRKTIKRARTVSPRRSPYRYRRPMTP